MHGRYVHFSARVATWEAGLVRFWLVAGDARNRLGRGGARATSRSTAPRAGSASISSSARCPPMPTISATAFSCSGAATCGCADPKLEVLTQEEALKVASLPISGVGNVRPH
jgi:hypothetical protein